LSGRLGEQIPDFYVPHNGKRPIGNAYYERTVEPERILATCPVCDQRFYKGGLSHNRKYCSNKCGFHVWKYGLEEAKRKYKKFATNLILDQIAECIETSRPFDKLIKKLVVICPQSGSRFQTSSH
jgi:hypothetical protein